MKEAGKILAETLEKTMNFAKVGMSTLELDQFAEDFIKSKNAKPGFKGFNGYKYTLCTALNDQIVHGIPRNDKKISDGDLLTIDCGVIVDGFYSDAARSKIIGTPEKEKIKIIETAKLALKKGIEAAKNGNKVSDISKAIEKIVTENNYFVIEDLTGHGIGRTLHEEPIVANYYDPNITDYTLEPGMTIAIEPIFAENSNKMITDKDGWTLTTIDNNLSVQIEETVLITQNEAEILTKL